VLTAKGIVTVNATAQAVLEFVLDLERYKRVDRKIVRVSSVHGPDTSGRVGNLAAVMVDAR
jgi:hypothetical protein